MMTTFSPSDSHHRLVKQAIDSGAANSIAEAEALFRGYRLAIKVDRSMAADPVNQATLLTSVALARRVFLGGVSVEGDLSANLLIPLPLGRTLAEAVTALGGQPGRAFENTPTVVIGGEPGDRHEGFCIRTAAQGWRGGILPIHSELVPAPGPAMPLAGMLSAALAVNEAFLFVNGAAPAAGHRVLGLSLWNPSSDIDWLEEDTSEPSLAYLPSQLWLIGLGHLGQAYLWGIGLLPYHRPQEVSLVLQDIDRITPSTVSTSILTETDLIGEKKTRAMVAWAERRGFTASIHERLFDASFKRQDSEPRIALCGLDNAAGRRALDQVGFDMVIEAGLGRGHRDFRTMRLHTLPGLRPASEIWKAAPGGENVEDRPAYKELMSQGVLDRCGMTLLAGKAVGAPFVGATAAALALSEVLRLLHGGGVHQLIDLDLLSLDQRVASRHCQDFSHLNPGFVRAEWGSSNTPVDEVSIQKMEEA